MYKQIWINKDTIFQYTKHTESIGTMQVNSQQPSWTSGRESGSDGTEVHMSTSDTNDGFFGRPVKILTTEWQPSVKLFQEFNPWSLFCEDPRVANRLAHFKNLKMNLNVQVLINGNPFYYGRAIMSYVPLHRIDVVSALRNTNGADIIEASQRPHIYVDPCKSEGGEIELPFVFPKPFMDIPTSDWRKMGKMFLTSINPLQHANGGTEPITLTVFAYATNVQLNTPTSRVPFDLKPQGEYGMISMPANTIANIAKRLSDAPVIGKFAKATDIIASAVSGLAVLFGYSRPRMLPNDGALVRHFGEMAVTDFADTSLSLALSAKKELTVDPSVVGLAPHDEMALVPLAMRESYISTFSWTENDAADTHLYSVDINPVLGEKEDGEYHITPMSWTALPFTYWKGSIEVRIQIVASAYHRGRLRVVWDPDYVVDGSIYNVNYSMLLDISESSEVVFKIGWGQNLDYLPIPGLQEAIDSLPNGIADATKKPYANGQLSIFVVNSLTSPGDEVARIQANVFARACDDFEVAVPKCGFLTGIEPKVMPLEPDPEDGDETTFAPARYSVYGASYDMRTDPIPAVSGQVIDVADSRTIRFEQYTATGGTKDYTMSITNGGSPLSMDILFEGNTYPFNMAANETKNFLVSTNTVPGWTTYQLEFDTGNSNFDDYRINSITLSSPGDSTRNVIINDDLENMITSSFTRINNGDGVDVFEGAVDSQMVIDIPVEAYGGQRVYFTFNTPCTVNGVKAPEPFQKGPYPTTESWVYAFKMPANRKFTITRPDYIGPGSWKPMVNSLSFWAPTSYVPQGDINLFPQGDAVEERMQDSDSANAPEALAPDISMGPPSDVRGLNDIYFGEVVSSWRQVLKRFTSVARATHIIVQNRTQTLNYDVPLYPISDFGSTTTVGNIVMITNQNLMTYVTSAYVCMRGSTRLKVTHGTDDQQKSTTSCHRVGITAPRGWRTFGGIGQTKWCGTARDSSANKPYAEFELPVYSNLRFSQPRARGAHNPAENNLQTYFEMQHQYAFQNTSFDLAYAAAEDFTLAFFLSTPVLVVS